MKNGFKECERCLIVNNNLPSIRFDKFKSNWSIRQIGELLIDVSRPIKMDDDQFYQLVTVKRRNAGIVSRGYFKGKDVLVKSQFVVKTGDYLISKRQIVHGANGIVPEHLSNSIVSNEYLVLHGTNELSVEYLSIISKLPIMYKMFYLSSYGVDIEKLVFNVSDWKKRELIIPSIEEQNEITLFFNELDRYIALHQQELDALKQTKQGFLQKMFPRNGNKVPEIRFTDFKSEWKDTTLNNITNIIGGGTPDTKEPTFWDGEIDWYSPTEIGKTIYANGSVRKITQLGLEKSSAKILPANKTILFTSRAGIGDTAILKKNGATNQGFQSLVVQDNCDVYFLYSMSKEIKKYALKNAAGSTFLEISGKNLGKMPLLIPSFEEQSKIGEFFRQLDEVIGLKEQELEALKQTKKGFLQKMFV